MWVSRVLPPTLPADHPNERNGSDISTTDYTHQRSNRSTAPTSADEAQHSTGAGRRISGDNIVLPLAVSQPSAVQSTSVSRRAVQRMQTSSGVNSQGRDPLHSHSGSEQFPPATKRHSATGERPFTDRGVSGSSSSLSSSSASAHSKRQKQQQQGTRLPRANGSPSRTASQSQRKGGASRMMVATGVRASDTAGRGALGVGIDAVAGLESVAGRESGSRSSSKRNGARGSRDGARGNTATDTRR